MQKQIQQGSPSKIWTTLELLNWTTAYFKSHKIDQPRATAEILVAHALRMERIGLYLKYDRPVEPNELKRLKGFIQRRLKNEPVAYIVGEKGFWSLDLKVNPHVLIPRPETEMMVEAALEVLPQDAGLNRMAVLDLGTGSGAIIIALACERPGHHFVAVDRSAKALEVARENAEHYGVASQVDFQQGDWYRSIKGKSRLFDLVVCNPPYIAHSDLETLSADIRLYEPLDALDGGPDGLAAIRPVLEQGPASMRPGGWLLMEIGHDQGRTVQALAKGTKVYENISILRDVNGLDRLFRARVQSSQRFDREQRTC